MARKLRSFQYQYDNFKNKLTSFAGLPLYIELAIASGLTDAIEKTMNSKSQGGGRFRNYHGDYFAEFSWRRLCGGY